MYNVIPFAKTNTFQLLDYSAQWEKLRPIRMLQVFKKDNL